MQEVYAERILLVEQPDGREMLKMALEHAGFEVDMASDGESAMETAAARAPAVIIVDVNLPHGWLAGRAASPGGTGIAVPAHRLDESRRSSGPSAGASPRASMCTW